MNAFVTYLARLLGLAAVYYIGGRLGLLLMIPPGQATAVWPPSGFALAGLLLCGTRCWPAVFLGAVGTSLTHADSITYDSLLLAATIACGATLQALVGAGLVRRVLQPPFVLERVRDILKLTILGGVSSCVINASVATVALTHVGFVSDAAFLSHWFTWWSGDVLGVVVFAPVMLLLFAGTKGEMAVSPRRKTTVLLSMMIMLGLVVSLFSAIRTKHEAENRSTFVLDSERLSLQFEKDLGSYLNILVATERFITASEYVSAREFALFTRDFFAYAPGLSGVSWVAKVPHDERAEFERSIAEQGYPGFEIRRRFDRGVLKRSEEKPVYFPITYIEPFAPNAVALGLDISGEDPVGGDIRKVPLALSRDEARPMATGRFAIVQAEQKYGFIIYQPVYDPARYGPEIEDRRNSLLGYVNGAFLLPVLVQGLAESAAEQEKHVVLRDLSAPVAEALLYDSRTPDYKEGAPESYDFAGVLTHSHDFEMAGRNWRLTFVENAAAVPGGLNRELWSVALAGVLYCGLFGAFILVVTARTAVVERIVTAKTGELHRANAELEEFAYRTSHDLRSPVVSSLGLMAVARDALAQKDYASLKTSLSHTQDTLTGLKSLIEDILQLTEVTNLEEDAQAVDFDVLLDEALAKMQHMDGFDRISIKLNLAYDGPLVLKKLRLRVILENLLSNAVKYQDRDRAKPFIRIETFAEDDDFVLRVTDNGLGIPAAQQKEIFKMFKRFHPRTAFGSGLGLYLVQKSAVVLGGRVEFSDPGKGARFTLKIPMKRLTG